MTHTITCELGCQTVIAVGETEDQAEEFAEETGARYYGGDEGPDEWACLTCIEAHEREGMAEAAKYDKEMQIAAIMQESRDAQDGMLERADTIFDAARDRGEI